MLFEELRSKNLILASASPRRKLLLEGLGLDFSQMLKETPEEYPAGIERENIALYLARIKANAFGNQLEKDDIIIAADTIVCLEGEVLNKPANRDEAISMLKMMAGKKHDVITGVCILSDSKECCFFSETKVSFTLLEDKEIGFYVDKFKPYD